MHSYFLRYSASLMVAMGLFALAAAPLRAQTYIAVGDSVAYGYMDPTSTPTGPAGYPGYAEPYDAFLSTQAGTPVTLLNLGIVGETTDTLLNNSVGNAALNSNYSGAPESQYALLSADLGSSVRNVTVQVGANDILHLAESPQFLSAYLANNTSTENALLASTLTQVQANYDTLLGQITTLAPQADVQVLGFYNPYAALPPGGFINDALRTVSPPLIQGLNGVIAQEAAKYHVQYVDLYDPFLGHEDALTLANQTIPSSFGPVPNDHPSAAGYGVITTLLESPVPVPEASTTVSLGLLLALGLGGAVMARRKKIAG